MLLAQKYVALVTERDVRSYTELQYNVIIYDFDMQLVSCD